MTMDLLRELHEKDRQIFIVVTHSDAVAAPGIPTRSTIPEVDPISWTE